MIEDIFFPYYNLKKIYIYIITITTSYNTNFLYIFLDDFDIII